MLRKSVFVFLILIAVPLVAMPDVLAAATSVEQITCPNCRQKYDKGTRHVCPPKPKPKSDSSAEIWKAIAQGIADGIEQGNRNRGPVLVDDFRQVYVCRNCGTRYYEGTRHVCPQQQSPQVTQGNPLPTSVAVGNSPTIKLANFDQRNIQAIQDSFLNPLKNMEIDGLKTNMPSEKQISDKIDKLNPPLSAKDKEDLMKAIKNGDVDKVGKILDNSGAGLTLEAGETFIGLAQVNDLIKKHENGEKLNQGDFKKILGTLSEGDSSLVGKLASGVQSLGKINKISKILDIASMVLNSGGNFTGTSIPTGIVPIVTFPDLPYGVVFPLGNGVYGIGTGGKGSIGIFQGYIPQPLIYGGNGRNSDTIDVNFFLHNDTDEDVQYRVNNSDNSTLEGNGYWTGWEANVNGGRIQVRLPSARKGYWTTASYKPGSYEFVKPADARSNWKLQEVKTEITISNTGNPMPFTFFTGDQKWVIEPGKDFTLTKKDDGNGVMTIQFARSADKEDVYKGTFGGKIYFTVGRDKSDGKWSLFPGSPSPVKPASPVQNNTSSSNTITYDDTTITASTVNSLPVLPSYD